MNSKKPYEEQAFGGVGAPKMAGRAKILLGIGCVLFSLLALRIFLYQTLHYDYYQKKVLEQMTTEASVAAARGNIYDANGVLLATNITTYRVFISPSSIAAAQAEHNKNSDGVKLNELIAENLSSILDVSYEYVMKQTGYTAYLDRTIQRQVDEERADQIRAFIDEYGLQQMIYLQATHTRYYPYSSLASHVLGFTGSDGSGLYGLELSYNTLLKGANGRYITARDAQGNEMPYEYKEYIAPEDGYNLNTTIDVFVQAALEEQLKATYIESNAQNRAAGIVMNVNTGEILAMATYPSFDLNDPWTLDKQSNLMLGLSGYLEGSDEYSAFKQELLLNMWSNKAITENYIPGSTFKTITAAMALEEDVVRLDEHFSCPGYKIVSGRKIRCHKTQGHGSLSFVQGIQQSCNPVLMTMGERLGISTFYDYFRSFGFTEKTGIDLPGEGSSIFAAEEDCIPLDLAIYAFGQNFNVTLIQQITAVSAVANGGYLVTPHTVSSITDKNGKVIQSFDTNVRRQIISAETCKTVAKILEEGVSGDGGAKNAYVPGYRIAAKTGTSEKKNEGSLGRYICSTVAFAPADNPQYAVIIMVDEPTSGVLYGSTVAAPYVGRVMETILPYLGVEAVYTDAELEKTTVSVPENCLYWNASTAKKFFASYGIEAEIVGDPDGIVYTQFPEKGTVLERTGAKVILYTEKNAEATSVKVPDVTGLSAAAANQVLINAGLNIRINGTKNYAGSGVKVTAQSLPVGSLVPRGSVVEITVLYLGGDDIGINLGN